MIVARQVHERCWLFRAYNTVTIFIQFGVVIFACRSINKFQWLYKLYAIYWICHVICVVLYTLLKGVHRNDFTMGGLMAFFDHISQLLAHLVILLESFAKDKQRKQIELLFVDFEQRFVRELGIATPNKYDGSNRYFQYRGWIVVILGFGLIIFTSFHISMQILSFPKELQQDILIIWHSLPSALALQFRTLEVIIDITVLNEYAHVLYYQINKMGERNIRKIFGVQTVWKSSERLTLAKQKQKLKKMKGDIIWVKTYNRNGKQEKEKEVNDVDDNDDADDECKLRACKRFYGDLYNMFKLINEHCGWSLFAFILMYYIYFVINTYWVALSLVVNLGGHNILIRNVGFLFIAIPLLWFLCWQCQNSAEESHHISSIMFKIVKPAAEKSYRDLVTEFSLQTIHQKYTITAKEFFNLNLNLFGSMTASIVTYLVILIQFMLAERSKVARSIAKVTDLSAKNLYN